MAAIQGPLTFKIENLPRHIIVGIITQLTIITKDSNGDRYPIGGSVVFVQLESSSAMK